MTSEDAASSTPGVAKDSPPSPLAVEPLWLVRDLAVFLRRSERWVWKHLQFDQARVGSIPHLRLPGGAPRFDPATIRAWLDEGCPAAMRVDRKITANNKRCSNGRKSGRS